MESRNEGPEDPLERFTIGIMAMISFIRDLKEKSPQLQSFWKDLSAARTLTAKEFPNAGDKAKSTLEAFMNKHFDNGNFPFSQEIANPEYDEACMEVGGAAADLLELHGRGSEAQSTAISIAAKSLADRADTVVKAVRISEKDNEKRTAEFKKDLILLRSGMRSSIDWADSRIADEARVGLQGFMEERFGHQGFPPADERGLTWPDEQEYAEACTLFRKAAESMLTLLRTAE